MPLVAVLDACVLYSFSTRDILLRLAEAGLFRAVWNAEILDEMARNLTANAAADGDRVRMLLEDAFEDAMDTNGIGFLPVVPGSVSPHDRHVVATALAQHAEVIVTVNLKDFARETLEPLGLAVQHPDEFLLNQLSFDRERTLQAVRDQSASLRRPPLSLKALALHVPNFKARLSELLFDLQA